MCDIEDENLCFWQNSLDSKWKKKGQIFRRKYCAVSKGELQNKRNPLDIYEYFLNDDICEHIAKQTNLYAKQKMHEKTLLSKMKRTWDKYWILTCKDEIKLLFGIATAVAKHCPKT
jgi:hypothetical protein